MPDEFFTSREVGVDETEGRFGYVQVLTCRECGQCWLAYSVEYEAFSRSGRWFRGAISQAEADAVSPETAVEMLGSLAWHWAGGSYFDGVTSKRKGAPRVRP